jgi:hypothetical protein
MYAGRDANEVAEIMAKPTIFLATQSGQRPLEIGVGVGASSRNVGKRRFWV